MIKLNSSNYSIWKPHMEDVFYTKDQYLPIYGDSKKAKDKNDDDWNILNRKTVAQIRTWVDQNVFHHVAQETKAHVYGRNLRPCMRGKQRRIKLL